MKSLEDIIKKRKSLEEIENRKKEMLKDYSDSYAEKLPNYNSDVGEFDSVQMPYKKQEEETKSKKLFQNLKNRLKGN